MPELAATARSWEGGQRRSSQEPPGEQPFQHPDRRPPACRMDSWDLHQSVVISYGSPLENEYQLWGLAPGLSCREEMDPQGCRTGPRPPAVSAAHILGVLRVPPEAEPGVRPFCWTCFLQPPVLAAGGQ